MPPRRVLFLLPLLIALNRAWMRVAPFCSNWESDDIALSHSFPAALS